ncbi:3-hydroxyacyl-CoA dehydrogenase family protein [Achromobacter sp. GG226]|uniref:3-hydroxyacyl-CoA dehydrogenase family protein n=1 Tax=Verticiella alkaliphila TaxID=2779529 RepID=UPI001C0DD53B|nr:3-hydroxyacyl-CoA dehydrogenase family protein [Verticiella sp. GG226]
MSGLTLAEFGGRPLTAGTDRVVVLGAGVMGPGIALVFAEHGFDVDLCETRPAALEQGLATQADALQLKAELGLTPADSVASIRARVHGHTDSDVPLRGARLVIEAVTENADVKRAVYARVQQLAPADTVVWSNTSTMNVFELAEPVLRARLLVAHWFAPPHILPLVEVVGEPDTQPGLVDQTLALLRALGKTPVRLEKFVPGFLINRLLRALGREAFFLMDQGVVTAENLDAAVRTSLAPRMQILGLLQRYDFTGLNLSLRHLGDPAMADAPVDLNPQALSDRVTRGDLGVTTGKGFYDYAGRTPLALQRERDVRLWQVLSQLGDLVTDPKPL